MRINGWQVRDQLGELQQVAESNATTNACFNYYILKILKTKFLWWEIPLDENPLLASQC